MAVSCLSHFRSLLIAFVLLLVLVQFYLWTPSFPRQTRGYESVAHKSENDSTPLYDSEMNTKHVPSIYHGSLALFNHTQLHTCGTGLDTVTIPTVPSLIIIGAQKSGTTALVHYLKAHPNIVPARKPRELHFFDFHYPKLKRNNKKMLTKSPNDFYCLVRKTYVQEYLYSDYHLSHILNNSSLYLTSFDKSPSYMHLQNGAKAIRKTLPWSSLKILAVLRNPVDRAYSHYQMEVRNWPDEMDTFEFYLQQELDILQEQGLIVPNDASRNKGRMNKNKTTLPEASFAIPTNMSMKTHATLLLDSFHTAHRDDPIYLRKGMYALQLRQWIATFSNSLLVLNYDDMAKDSPEYYWRVLDHAGLPRYDLPNGYDKVFSGSYSSMSNKTRRLLEQFFEPYNRQLHGLLGDNWKGVWQSGDW